MRKTPNPVPIHAKRPYAGLAVAAKITRPQAKHQAVQQGLLRRPSYCASSLFG